MATPLKIERMKRGIKQWELASRLRVTQAALSSWELGHRNPSRDMKLLIARELDVDIDILFPGGLESDVSPYKDTRWGRFDND